MRTPSSFPPSDPRPPPAGSVREAVRVLLDSVTNPIQYLGREHNSITKDPQDTTGRIALCYPDTYEIGSSHNGLQILYHVVNCEKDLAAERCFTPWPDMANLMRQQDVPLFSLENHLPIRDFDILGFTLQTELTYSNVLETLDLSCIPLLAEERSDSDPIVIAGGHGAHSPEVLAPFIDLFTPGDGEEILVPLLRFVAEKRQEKTPRHELLRELAGSFPWAYVPSLYEPCYDEADPVNGPFRGLRPLVEEASEKVSAASVFDFSATPMVTRPLVPYAKSVHDKVNIEIMRGCTRGCRFCQAGMITRPMRYRTVEQLVEAADEAIATTGYKEVTLTSLSSGDYPWIEELLREMSARFTPQKVSVSLPSLRVTGELAHLPGMISTVRKSGLTFAPEVATDRLRKIINKDILNEDVLKSAKAAYEEGWERVKLYYMIGIPGEREEDLTAIVEFADQLSKLRQKVTGKAPAHVNVTVSTFVPKAFVPFQWDGMMPPDTIKEKQRWMRGLNRNRRVRLKFHSAEQSFLEAILSRGDRRLAPALIEAHRHGARFDAWSEHFNLTIWRDAFEATGIDPDAFALRERAKDEVLPWDHLDIGPDRNFLWSEREKARELITTDYCVGKVCHVCGVPPSLCFAIKRDMGLLNSEQQGILEIDESGVTRGVAGVDPTSQRRLTVKASGPTRKARQPGVSAGSH